MGQREEMLRQVAATLLDLPAPAVLRVGIDGVDGAGKTFFADELAPLLDASGRRSIRASVDGFHNPRAIRYRLGKQSPEGFFRDSYNYPKLREVLLEPLSPGGSGRFRRAIFDHRVDAPVTVAEEQAAAGDILLFDGIFLHRPELRGYWDFSIFLDVAFDISIPRGAQRDGGPPALDAPENHRYIEGQRLYLRECDPKRHATLVINNDDLASPRIEG